MSEIGQWTWYELMTLDVDKATSFYRDLTDWGLMKMEGVEIDYWMWTVGQTAVGGVMELPKEARENGMPPHWMGSVKVEDIEASMAKVKELGGQIFEGPDDIPGGGRFAFGADPQGAVLGLYQAGEESGEESGEEVSISTPGAFCWQELWTSDIDAALSFYGKLFGWEQTEVIEMDDFRYILYGKEDQSYGGIGLKDAQMPRSFWMSYITVEDIDVATEKVISSGGKLLHGPHEVPGGARAAQYLDNQGVAFGLTS